MSMQIFHNCINIRRLIIKFIYKKGLLDVEEDVTTFIGKKGTFKND